MTDVMPDVAPAEGFAASEPSAPNIVNVGKCRCPTRPHRSGDTVTLRPKITIPLGIAGLAVIEAGGGFAAVYGGLTDVYLDLGIIGWSFLEKDEDGIRPVPVTAEARERLLPFDEGGLEVAEAADALYRPALMRPLRKRYPERFPLGPTESSTPPTPGSGSPRRTPSGRSSRNGTAGKP